MWASACGLKRETVNGRIGETAMDTAHTQANNGTVVPNRTTHKIYAPHRESHVVARAPIGGARTKEKREKTANGFLLRGNGSGASAPN